jgi:hypothetical protein
VPYVFSSVIKKFCYEIVNVPDTVNLATLSLAGPTQELNVLVPGATLAHVDPGNLTTTIPDPPALPPVLGAALPPSPSLAVPAEFGDPGAPAPPVA